MKNFERYIMLVVLLSSFNYPTRTNADNGVNPAKPRRCYSCEGINCQRTSKVNVTADCSDLLDICVTVFEDYTVVAKGCLLFMPEEHRNKCHQRNNPECLTCFGELCNNKGREDFKCIECKSSDDSKCASDTSDMKPVQCSNPTSPNSYCFVRSSGKEGVSRGCFAKLSEQLECMKDASCSLCLSDDAEACNSYRLLSASAANGIWLSTWAIIGPVVLKICRH